MTKRTRERNNGQAGKHRPELVQFGAMITTELKATYAVGAAKAGMTMVDFLKRGAENELIRLGILDRNGQVSPEYRDAVSVAKEMLDEQLANKRAERKARKETK